MTDEEWDRMVSVNQTGVFTCGQECARRFVEAGRGGTIVNTASMAGKKGNDRYLSHYIRRSSQLWASPRQWPSNWHRTAFA